MSGAAPVSRLGADRLDSLFAPLRQAEGVLVAVSGGPDSVAVLDSLKQWSAASGTPLASATVDHAIRPESAAEAQAVADFCRGLGVPHATLRWDGEKPPAGLPEAAREARYSLLVAHARSIGATHLVTAHTLDDQAETVFIRLSRGSGLAGLAAMRPEVLRDGIAHVRPFLGLRKAELLAYCRERGLAFVEDPSNTDPRFTRARWRRLMPMLEAEGLSPERLAALADRIARAEDALETKARDLLSAARVAGADFRADPFLHEPFEIALRALLMACEDVAPRQPLRLNRAERCLTLLRKALETGGTLRRTLAGALVTLEGQKLRFEAEPRRHRGRYPCGEADTSAKPHSLGKGGSRA